ncbi:MAG: glycoside hydrolase family 99-like domain-containing protein [Bacilli bacterium]|nr:glycoside hydrolase family 99-like domain-containing protein [Bacilli bacterium]
MGNTKVLAIHLPAFHRIPENDEWWGEGFTEWDNVKSGKKYYNNHYQPVVPLNNNYYDLSNINDIKYQFDLANKYDIYGFIFYHYWFGNGEMIFEKPVELILNDNAIQGHYCFCWANESWMATWHGQNNRVLKEQKYPGKNDWEAHFMYLLKFFKDERYIKEDNKPMLYIYKPCEIPDYNEMLEYFNNRLIDEGFSGIYVVEYISSKNKLESGSPYAKAVMEFEPLYTTFFDISKLNLFKRLVCKKLNLIDYQSYDKLWKYKLKRTRTYNGKIIQKSCFVAWDNSSRKGKNSMIVKNSSPEKFKKYLTQLINTKRVDSLNDYLVINAWNEWSEGAYLEPDNRYYYSYLEAIKSSLENNNEDCL